MTDVASTLMLDDSATESALALALRTVNRNSDTMGESASLPALPSTNGEKSFSLNLTSLTNFFLNRQFLFYFFKIKFKTNLYVFNNTS